MVRHHRAHVRRAPLVRNVHERAARIRLIEPGRLTVPAVLAALAVQLGTDDHAALRSRILPADEVPARSGR